MICSIIELSYQYINNAFNQILFLVFSIAHLNIIFSNKEHCGETNTQSQTFKKIKKK